MVLVTGNPSSRDVDTDPVEPAEPAQSWVFVVLGLAAVLLLLLAVVDAEQQLPQGPAWAVAVGALVAGASSYVVRPVEVRAMVMGAVALVGAGLITHVWGQEDLTYVWFASAVLGGCLASLTAPGRRRHLR